MGDTTEDENETEINEPSVEDQQPTPSEDGNGEDVVDDVTDELDEVDAAPEATDEPEPKPPPEGKKVLKIRSDALKGIKSKAREAGREEAVKALNDELKELGFDSLADMAKEIKKLKEGAAEDTAEAKEKEDMATKKDNTQSDEETAKLRAEREAAIEAKRKANRARAKEEKRRRAAQRQLEAEREERKLERMALQSGVKDVDYALHLLRRELREMRADGKTEELEAFDAKKYFKEDLKTRHPHLYQVSERKADTSGADRAAKGEGGEKPTPGQAGGGEGGGSDTNAMDRDQDGRFSMSQSQFQKTLREKGLAVPGSGF